MPQLNPSPWFAILIFSWLVLLAVVVPKVLAHIFPNNPAPQNAQNPKTEIWTWPWT
uniref:ATP synthase complex subunit 8 n=2 Tax=Acentrogobius TaxID=376738 RepID=L7X3P1_ACECH|nr:ATP synthase F0 subunit 8 [Acentrogobius chlorostigmatoides]AGC93492.1 ATP synthase F0 subunit 8 [Acentrogobius chlorostigmatoides]AKU36820.1 ATP synthase subunit 8 [Acentrogobius sp. QHY-2015]